MEEKRWHKTRWTAGAAHEISGFDRPLTSFLDDAASRWPNQTYTIFQDGRRTFAQVKDAADRIANFLASRGIKKGDRVAIFLPNLPHYPPIFFGILKAGGACVTCNPMYKTAELNLQLKDSGAKAVFVMDHPQFYKTGQEAVQGTGIDPVVYCSVKSFLPPLKGFLGGLLGKIPKAESHDPKHLSFEQALAGQPKTPPKVEIKPKVDLAVILYTGGTTGVPKGASLTHHNFVSDVLAVEEWVRLSPTKGAPAQKLQRGDPKTCFIGVLPWYHSYGHTLTMLAAARLAAKVVCVPDPRAGKPPFTEVLKLIQEHKVTIMHGVPAVYNAVVNHPNVKDFDLSSIMACGSGAAPLPVEVAKKFEERTGAILFEGYGLSETAPMTHANPSFVHLRKFGSIGLPVPGTDSKIMDLETGTKELPVGQDGEIAVSGPQVMKGYWKKPEEDAVVFRQIEGKRFFLTGDIGHLDQDGFTFVTDRKKDMIDIGGLKAYPREVEEILYTHPKINMAAVIGIPDEKSGQAVKAFVVLQTGQTATPEEIIEFCKEKLAPYKRPRFVEFRKELPVTNVGKVLRRQLRDEEWAKMGKKPGVNA
jgi:long-chain acyl-CoA synthetase